MAAKSYAQNSRNPSFFRLSSPSPPPAAILRMPSSLHPPRIRRSQRTPASRLPSLQEAASWGQQVAVFERVKGVLDTTAGYDGGTKNTATYDQVSSETTQHAESVKVIFDPAKISYGTLLHIFFSVHDLTIAHAQVRARTEAPATAPPSLRRMMSSAASPRLTSSAAQRVRPKLSRTPSSPRSCRTRASSDAYESYHHDYALHNPDNPYTAWSATVPRSRPSRKNFPALYVEYHGK